MLSRMAGKSKKVLKITGGATENLRLPSPGLLADRKKYLAFDGL